MKHALFIFLALSFFSTAQAEDKGARFLNLDRMISDLNFRPYFKDGVDPEKKLKVAVFDNGFRDATTQIGDSLPANTQIHPGPNAVEGEEETHGFYMAKIFYSLLTLGGEDTRYAPEEFHLYNTYGYSNLKFAVEDAIARGVNIVLYSQTWEYGGNFDGKGFINALVSKATKAGIIWINNSGNFGITTYNGKIVNGKDDWLKLPGQNQSIEIRCEENTTEKCQLRTVLSWNDFSDDVDTSTDKDLDFVLADDTLNVVQSSSLKQDGEGKAPGTSKYPREIITAELKPGLYFLRVKNRSKNFGNKDRLRITASGDFITMKNADKSESLLSPADNSSVISVGALDSDKTSISVKLNKPDLWTKSLVKVSKEDSFKGTSNSAAMVAAGAAIMFSLDPDLTRAKFIKKTSVSELPGNNNGAPGNGGVGLPLEALGFGPVGAACFSPVNVDPATLPPYIQQMLAQGGVIVNTSAGWKIFYPNDPLPLLAPLFRRAPNDIIGIGPYGPAGYQRSGLFSLPPGFIEMVQIPQGQQICGTTPPANGGNEGENGEDNGKENDNNDDGQRNGAPSIGHIFRLPNR